MIARQASPTRLTTACIFLPLRVDDSSSAVMYPLTYFSYGGARETNHRCSAVHFYRRGKPAAFFHNAGDTYRKATLTRPKPCRTAIQIGNNTRGIVESDIAAFATLVRTKLCYRGRCGVRGGMVKFNNPGGMVIVGVRISDFIREYQIANLCEQRNILRISVRNRVAWRCQAFC